MCGIAGFYDEKVKNFQKIKKFTNQLIHRGPDEEGFFSNYKGLSLGMRRLSIIDLKNGSQPIITDKSVLIFNGEIFNFIELKNKYLKNTKNLILIQVLSYLYDKKGLSILKELNGFSQL